MQRARGARRPSPRGKYARDTRAVALPPAENARRGKKARSVMRGRSRLLVTVIDARNRRLSSRLLGSVE